MTITPTPGTEKRRRKLVDWNLGDGRNPSRPAPVGSSPSGPEPGRRRRGWRRSGRPGTGEAGSWGPPAVGGKPPNVAPAPLAPPGDKGPPAKPAAPAPKPAAPAEKGSVGASREVGPAVDPRMRRRRAEVVRASGWRRLRIAGSIVAAGALLVGLFGVAHTSLVSARHIRVTGAPAGRDGQLLAAADLTVGQPMIDVHPSRAVAALQVVPWVASASVRRVWPATVQVVVRARQAVAQVPTGSSPAGPVVEVDLTGRIIARLPRARHDLPLILGTGTPGAVGQWLAQSRGSGWPLGSAPTRPIAVGTALDAADDAVSGALALAGALQADGVVHGVGAHRTRVVHIEVAADSTVSAELTPGPVTVFFGAPTLLAAKATALESMLRAVTLTGGSLLDLQVPDRPTVTGAGVTAPS